ncbi:MAG: hypothetical protein IK032_04500 [Bacteroidales bacterium]|nr:hypothetical protein [Bacteroidales bacterium]
MATKSKMELVLELHDRMTSGLEKAKAAVSKNTAEMKSKVSALKQSVVGNFNEIKEAFPAIGKAVEMLKNPFVAAAAVVTGLCVAFGKLKDYAGQAIEAYKAQSVAETQLAAVMKLTMNATEAEIQSIKELASEQQRLGVVGDEVQLAGAKELGTYLTKADSLKQLMPVMNDMVAHQYGLNATQEQAVQIATMLGKVMNGEVGALKRYGYEFDENQKKILETGTESQRLATLVDVVSESVGGLNEALAQTPPFYETIAAIKEHLVSFFERNREAISSFISAVAEKLSALTQFIFSLAKVVKDVVAFMWDWKEVLIAVAGAFALANGQAILHAASVGLATIAEGALTAAQWLLNVAMSANPIGIIITVIGVLIGIIVHLCRKFQGWSTVWNAVKTFLVNSFKQFVANWKFGFDEIVFAVKIVWARIKAFGEHAAALFDKVGRAIKAALSFNFSEAKEIMKEQVTTDADKEIDRLKQERDENRKKYANETMQRVKETKDAWKNISLTKKEDKEESSASASSALSPSGGGAGAPGMAEAGGGGAGSGDATGSVVGSAKQIRNITINIDSFIKGGINTTNTEMQHMSGTEISQYLEEMFMRMIRNAETSY